MDRKKAEKLMQLHEQGYLVIVDDHSYVDGPVKRIYANSDETGEGAIVYDSDVFTGRRLAGVWDGEVTVWQNVTDWDVKGGSNG